MNKYIIALFASSIALISLEAQTLSNCRNNLRAGDIIVKQQVEYVDPGVDGRNTIWNFSHVNMVNDKYRLIYYYPTENDTVHMIGREHQTNYHYLMASDTLWLTSYENLTTTMHYNKPEALLKFPLCYGDTLQSTFSSRGMYCQRIDLLSEGYTNIVADATGRLITPDNDTLHTIRVCRVKEFTNIGSDSTRMRLISYQWFATGSRYPVFETVKSYIIRNDSVINDFATSFYFSIIDREQLAFDLVNAMQLPADALDPDNILIGCTTYPNPVSTDLTVNYQLSLNARISFLLCDMGGQPWGKITEKALDAGIQNQRISMSGLPSGNYALYISVNGKMYRRTVIKI